jgi:hypothetical protein
MVLLPFSTELGISSGYYREPAVFRKLPPGERS